MRRSQLHLAILVVMGVLVLGACDGFKSADDKGITTNIQAKLFSDPVLKTRDIRVDSRNGIVTVTGTVGTDLEKAAVERIARQEDGVKNVVNLLSVTSQSATPPVEGVEKAESAAPPQPAAPPVEPPAPEKPHLGHHTRPVKDENKAASELRAYTNSVAPDAAANPVPNPAPANAAAATPAVDPYQVSKAPAAPSAPAPAPMATGPATPPPAPAPQPREHLSIPSGTVVTVRMVDGVDSSRNQPGEEFAATLDSPLVVGDRVMASRGADARVRLVEAKTAGRMTGRSELQLELINLTINGVPCPTQSGYYEQHGASRGTRTAETVGGGAVLGALLGGLLGRGRGAAIGSVAGAGAGTAVQVSTKGKQVKVPAETKIDFTLKDPIDFTIGAGQ